MKIKFNDKVYETRERSNGHIVSLDGKILFALKKDRPLLCGEVVEENQTD